MIRGSIDDNLDATIQLIVGRTSNDRVTATAVIDTGFSGYLTLPSSIVQQLALPWIASGQALLADGSITMFDVHIGTIQWDDTDRMLEIEAADTDPLVGMRLLHGYQLVIEVKFGGGVIIMPIVEDADSDERTRKVDST